MDHMVESRPPLHAVGTETHGSSVLRWFLHRIIPYPTFLTDVYWTATRFGVSADWIKSELETDSALADRFRDCAYHGAFSNFRGPRWWRAGLAHVIAELSDGKPFDREALNEGLRQASSQEPAHLPEKHPVLALDPSTMEATQVVEANLAVQINPDGWPLFAAQAWAAREDVLNDPSLKDLVSDPSVLSLETEE